MLPQDRIAATLLSILAVLAASPAQAQGVEYDVTVIGDVPGSYITYTGGMNDNGVVVGMAMFIPGGLKAYTWTASQGFTILPTPPTISDYGAVDINNAGVIAGDGGGDGGEIWRYSNGTYEMLGVLSGTPIPHAAAINSAGDVVGTCFGNQFYNPHHSFLAAPGVPMVSILDYSNAYGVNDSGQVVGSAPLSVAYRYTPGVGVELLPPLGNKIYADAYGINNAGKVVGTASSSAEHSNVPFLFTDAGGMQEIGNFGGRAYAFGINNLDEVLGSWQPFSGDHRPWVWSATQGVRFLNDVMDQAPGAHALYVRAINNAGQILVDGSVPGNSLTPVLLTPRDLGPTSYCDPPNANSVSSSGALLSHVNGQPGEVMTFQVDGTPTTPGILFGTTQVDLPLGCGRRCVAGSIVRSSVYLPTSSSFQPVLDTTGIATTPFNIQYWYRDNANSGACGAAVNLSNALGF